MTPTSPLPADYIALQKQRLIALRDSLAADIRDASGEERRLQLDSVDEPEDAGDDAQKTNLLDNDAALVERNRARLGDVERALAKIEDGSYGLSDLTGAPIPRARLDAAPESLGRADERPPR